MKNKSSFINNCYEWLFSTEERSPIGYIIVFSIAIIISLAVSLFIVSIDRHVDGIILWMFK